MTDLFLFVLFSVRASAVGAVYFKQQTIYYFNDFETLGVIVNILFRHYVLVNACYSICQ